MTNTNITEEHSANFEALTSGEFDNFALFSCFVNGEPTSAIAAVVQDEDGIRIHPMFVAVTPGMILTDHEGVQPNGDRKEAA